MRKLYFLFLLFSLTIKGTFAQWNADPTVANAICVQPYEQNDIRLISDGNGGALVTWADSRNDSSAVLSDIYIQHINKNGIAEWQTNGIVVCDDAAKQSTPVSITDGMGGAIVAWNDYRNGDKDIYAQRIDSAGNAMWTINGVEIVKKNFPQQGVSIRSDKENGAIIVWEDSINGNWDIYIQRINSKGIVQWNNGGVAVCTNSQNQINPKLDVLPNGETILTWQDKRNGNDYDIYAQKISRFGVPQWTSGGIPIAVERDSQINPKIKIDSSLSAIIAWQDKRTGDHNIYAQQIDSLGNIMWANNGIVVCDAQNNQSAIDMTTEGISDGAIITWKDSRGNNTSIYCQKLNLSGTTEWIKNGVLVSDDTRDQIRPNITGDGSGGGIIVWQDSTTTSWDVYTQYITNTGQALWATGGVGIGTAKKDQTKPKNISDGEGNAIYAFKDGRSGDYDVYTYKFAITGGVIGQSQTVCSGTSPAPFTELVAPEGNNHTYQWQSSTDGINFINDGPTTVTYTVTTGLTAPVYYRRITTGTSNSVSSSAFSNIIKMDITDVPASPGNITTNFRKVCQTQQGVPYEVREVPNATSYNWTYSGNNVTIIDTSEAYSIKANFSLTSTSGSISVTASNECGTGPPSLQYDITVYPLPGTPSAISGQSIVCQGEKSVSYSIPPVSDANFYTWEYTGTGASTLQTNDSITIDFSENATSGILTVVGNNNCNRGPSSPDFPITVNQKPQGTFNGNAICTSDTKNGQLTWIKSSGTNPFTIVYNDGTANRTQDSVYSGIPFDVFSNPTTTNTYTLVSVTSDNCSRTIDFTNTTTDIMVTDGLPVITSNPTDITICSGNVSSYKVEVTNAFAYQWQVSTDGGATYNDIDTSATNIDYINFKTSELTISNIDLSENGNLFRCTIIPACGSNIYSQPATMTVYALPDSAGTISGKAVACQKEEGVVYTIPPIANATDYVWNYTGTGSTVTATSNTVTIDMSEFATSGVLTVKGISDYCEGATSEEFRVTVLQSPVSAGIITGSPDVCQNQKQVAYQIPILHQHSLYDDPTFTWIYTGTGVTFSGDTDPVTVDFSSDATSGILTVARLQKCGHGQFSKEFEITVHPSPSAPYLINDSIENCNYSYSIPPLTNTTSYIWEYSGTGETISGTDNEVSLYFSEGATSGYLTVKGQNEFCTGPVSEPKSVGYDPNCITGIDEMEAGKNYLFVYPNPSNGIITIDTYENALQPTNVSIFDMWGHQVFQSKNNLILPEQIDLSHLSSGMYILKVMTIDTNYSFKITITH